VRLKQSQVSYYRPSFRANKSATTIANRGGVYRQVAATLENANYIADVATIS